MDRRKSIEPCNFEQQMFFYSYSHLWSIKDINDFVNESGSKLLLFGTIYFSAALPIFIYFTGRFQIQIQIQELSIQGRKILKNKLFAGSATKLLCVNNMTNSNSCNGNTKRKSSSVEPVHKTRTRVSG